MTAIDEDKDVPTYKLVDLDQGPNAGTANDQFRLFDIDQATGQITVGAGTVLNFEEIGNRSYTMRVEVRDPTVGEGPTTVTEGDHITVTVRAMDMPEPPTTPHMGDVEFTIEENSAAFDDNVDGRL